ncbi:hypothetical protein HYV80_00895 [Candidatus Woesearchaeota archaeon]|nr:hypothetical protein [Candidatus Woesearchaeota archaeon]
MFDNFAKEKSDFLNKKDKSRKGCIDNDAVNLVKLINSKRDYYTTSSCSGRIVLLEVKSNKKNECSWIFTKHAKVNLKEIIGALAHYNKKISKNRELPLKAGIKEETSFENSFKHPVWLKQEPIILHVACRNLEAANNLLSLSRRIFKHSGILSMTERKAVVEIIGNEKIETVVADENFAADKDYLKNLIKYANKNFEENKKKSERFLKVLESNL